jgi:hypothetical protein
MDDLQEQLTSARVENEDGTIDGLRTDEQKYSRERVRSV